MYRHSNAMWRCLPCSPRAREFHPSSQTALFNLQDWLKVDFEANAAGTFDLVVHADKTHKAPRIP